MGNRLLELKNSDIKNLTEDGQLFNKFIHNKVFKKFIKQKSYGTQDGGCLMFALFLKKVFKEMGKESSIVMFSRNKVIEDHFALKLESNKYGVIFIDSDGIHTETDMKDKIEFFDFLNTFLVENIDIYSVKMVELDETFVNYLVSEFKDDLTLILKEFL